MFLRPSSYPIVIEMVDGCSERWERNILLHTSVYKDADQEKFGNPCSPGPSSDTWDMVSEGNESFHTHPRTLDKQRIPLNFKEFHYTHTYKLIHYTHTYKTHL